MGVTDDLPDPTVRLGEADHRQRVVLVALGNVHGDVFIEPVVTADDVGHAAEGLEDHVAILPDKKFVELLRGVGSRTIVVILGSGFSRHKSQNQKECRKEFSHPGLSSELCGKAPASP